MLSACSALQLPISPHAEKAAEISAACAAPWGSGTGCPPPCALECSQTWRCAYPVPAPSPTDSSETCLHAAKEYQGYYLVHKHSASML